MDQQSIWIVNTGAANLASVRAALGRCGKSTKIAASAEDILLTRYVVLPGVGSFGMAIDRLRAQNLIEPLRERIGQGRPTLAICLGLQLMASGSEESADSPGLGVLNTIAGRINGNVRVPQFGWNNVVPSIKNGLVTSGYAYFANSYVLIECDDGWNPAFTTYGHRFISAIERGCVLACQFHPELSGAWGHELLTRWLRKGATIC